MQLLGTQIYYEDYISHNLKLDPNNKDTFLEAVGLIQTMEVNSRKLNMVINPTECRGVEHVDSVFANAIQNFEMCQFSYGMIIHTIDFRMESWPHVSKGAVTQVRYYKKLQKIFLGTKEPYIHKLFDFPPLAPMTPKPKYS